MTRTVTSGWARRRRRGRPRMERVMRRRKRRIEDEEGALARMMERSAERRLVVPYARVESAVKVVFV